MLLLTQAQKKTLSQIITVSSHCSPNSPSKAEMQKLNQFSWPLTIISASMPASEKDPSISNEESTLPHVNSLTIYQWSLRKAEHLARFSCLLQSKPKIRLGDVWHRTFIIIDSHRQLTYPNAPYRDRNTLQHQAYIQSGFIFPHLEVESQPWEKFLLQEHHFWVEVVTLLSCVCRCHPKHFNLGECMNPVESWCLMYLLLVMFYRNGSQTFVCPITRGNIWVMFTLPRVVCNIVF